MIDPKFNELPVVPIEGEKVSAGPVPIHGLSINDTIAAEANKSVGAAGTNTSGVTLGLEEQDPSTRLDIEPVMPVEGDEVYTDTPPTHMLSDDETTTSGRVSSTPSPASDFEDRDFSSRFDIEPVSHPFSTEDVAALAYELWRERGCPMGSPGVDWLQAEQDLILRSRGSKAAVASV